MRFWLYATHRRRVRLRVIPRCACAAVALVLELGPAPLSAIDPHDVQESAAERSEVAPRKGLRDRTMACVVGIRASLSEPRLTFKGKRKITAEITPSEGTGSGVIVDSSGLILTCAHVVGDA